MTERKSKRTNKNDFLKNFIDSFEETYDANSEKGWSNYRIFILSKIKENREDIACLQKTQNEFSVELAKLQVKIALYASVIGAVVSIVVSFILSNISQFFKW